MSQDAITNQVTKTASGQLDVVTLSQACGKEFYITASPDNKANPHSMFENLIAFAEQKNARIVTQQVFGGFDFYSASMNALKKNNGQLSWPVMWLQGDGCKGPNLSGTLAYAVEADSFKPIEIDGKIIGAAFEDNYAEYCMLGNMLPADISLSRSAQARDVFEKIEAALQFGAGMDFSNVIRSWFYLDHILDWYDEFNRVRTDFFTERGVFNGLMPASTGIGAANYARAALVADILAVKPKNNNVTISEVTSPLQCSAADYKSSFARAVEVAAPDYRKLYISGTASIAPGGETVHIDNTEKQIALTMEVVSAILQSRKMDWHEVSRAIAYFRDITEKPLFDKYCRENDLPVLPVVASHCHVCRDDLLFELELDAIVTT